MSQRLNSYLRTSAELSRLSVKAGQLLALQRQYERLVPASLQRFSRVMQLEQRVLTLVADNSAIAAKLRQLAPELARQLRDKGCEVTGIQVQVQVAAPVPAQPVARATLSAEGGRRLSELSVALSDSPLKKALQRLARNSVPPAKT